MRCDKVNRMESCARGRKWKTLKAIFLYNDGIASPTNAIFFHLLAVVYSQITPEK